MKNAAIKEERENEKTLENQLNERLCFWKEKENGKEEEKEKGEGYKNREGEC